MVSIKFQANNQKPDYTSKGPKFTQLSCKTNKKKYNILY